MVMKPNTYPKFWSNSDTVISVNDNEDSDHLIKEEDDDSSN